MRRGLASWRVLVCLVGLWGAGDGRSAAQEAKPPVDAAQTQPDLAEAMRLSQTVMSLYAAQRYAEALPLAERALALRERALTPADPQVVAALFNLASVQQALGKFDKAEPLYLRLLSVHEQTPAAMPQARLAEVLTALGVIRARKGDVAKAISYFEQALAARTQAGGGEHMAVVPLFFNLAELYIARADYARAEAALARAFKILYAAQLPVDDPRLKQAHNRTACLIAASNRRLKSENIYPPASAQQAGATGDVLNGKAIYKPQPAYPDAAKYQRIQGIVVVKIVVDETGKVIEAEAICGHPLLAQASVTAAREARFTPTLLDGQPVKVSGYITYTFALL